MKNFALALSVAALTMVVVLATAFKLDQAEQDRYRVKLRADTLNHVSSARARLESVLNAKLYITGGLVAYVSNHPEISPEEFRSLAKPLYSQLIGVQSIRLARDAVISHIYPMGGLEGDLGTKLLEKPPLREPILRAIRTRKTVMAGPLQAAPGAPVFLVSRTPIFLAKRGKEDKLWGLTCIFIYQDALLKEAGLADDSALFRWALRGNDALGGKGKIFWGDPRVFEADPVVLDITLPNGSWQIAAVPREGWDRLAPGTRWLRAGSPMLAGLAGLLVWFWVRNPARLRELVAEATGALRASEAKYRELTELAPVGIFLTNLEGNYLLANSEGCRMVGNTLEEMLRCNIRDMLPEEELPTHRERLLDLVEGRTVSGECRLRRADGSIIPVEMSASRVPDNGIQWIVRDVSERKQIEGLRYKHQLELEHASRLHLIGEMASGLAHELGQPLSAAQNYVGGCIRRLQGGCVEGSLFLDPLKLANAQLSRAGDIIRHVKDFVRKREPSRAPLDINQLIHDVLVLLEQEVKKYGATVRLLLEMNLPAITADRIEIEQVVLNLVKNGLEAMKDCDLNKRELTVCSYCSDPGSVTVAIIDQGQGISEEKVVKLFSPFFTTKPEGMGLGLSISRSIVEDHGGSLEVRNAPEGGATAHFTLPVSGRE